MSYTSVYDTRVQRNYGFALIQIITSFIFANETLICYVVDDPLKNTNNILDMISDIAKKNKLININIVIFLRYTNTNYGVLYINQDPTYPNPSGAYFETKGTINNIYTSIFLPYLNNDLTINMFETKHRYNSTADDVSVYTLYELERVTKDHNLDTNTSSDNIRQKHYNLLNANGVYSNNFDANGLLYKITYSKNQTIQPQSKSWFINPQNDVKYDPRAKTNYDNDLMIIFLKYILTNQDSLLDYMIIENPQQNSHNAVDMITDVVNKDEDVTIGIILKYTPTNYGLLIIKHANNDTSCLYFETKGTINKIYIETFRKYFFSKKTNVDEYNTQYKTTVNNVGVYTIHELIKIINFSKTFDPNATESDIRIEHYKLLHKNGFYENDFDLNTILHNVRYHDENPTGTKQSADNGEKKSKSTKQPKIAERKTDINQYITKKPSIKSQQKPPVLNDNIPNNDAQPKTGQNKN